MDKFLRIARLRLDERFGFSRVRFSKDASQRRAPVVYAVTRILLYAALFAAMTVLCRAAAAAGYGAALPVIAYLSACVLSFLLTLLAMNDALSGSADSEYLLSAPIPEGIHVALLLLKLYFRSLPAVLLLCVPAGIAYAETVPTDATFWGRWGIGLLLTEMPFGGIAAIFGMFITLCLAESPKKNQIQTGISAFCLFVAVTLVLFILDLSLSMLNRTGAVGPEAAEGIQTLLTKNFAFARFYQNAIIARTPAYLFLFIVMSLLWYAAFAFFIRMSYRILVISLRCPVLYREYEWRPQRQKPVKQALFRQNLSRLTGSRSYFTHIMIGLIPALLLPANLCLFGVSRFLQAFGGSVTASQLRTLAPTLVCLFLGIGNTAYCSCSMEGKRCWITKAAPVPAEMLRNARLKAQLVLMLPAAFLSSALFCLALGGSAMAWLVTILVPTLWCVLLAWIGVRIDERFSDTSGESEDLILHRGLSYVLGYLPGIIFPAVMLGVLVLPIL